MLCGDWLRCVDALQRAPSKSRSRIRRSPSILSAEIRAIEQLEERCLLSATSSLADVFSLAVDTDSYDDSRILLQLQEGASTDKLAGLFDGAVFENAASLVPELWQVHLPENVSVETALETYRRDASVMFAEPDYIIQLTATPNDSLFGSLWGLNNTGQSGGTFDADIDAVEAWNTTTGSRSTIVAVIDTGVDYTHPDLAANIWLNTDEVAGNGLDDDGNGYIDDLHGFDFVNNDGDPMDDQNHGTHVAGTIGAVSNNGSGVVGVNWNVQIMALKFLSASGSGFTSDAVRALDYAVANGAHLSNNSWGGGGASSAMNSAISRARNAGHIFVAAAGNNGSNNDSNGHYPSNYTQDNVISVAATDRNDRLASFSNFGATTVDLAAPGVSILSTVAGGGYASYSGTSMATPHVAGVVALVHSQHPNWSHTQIINQVLNTVDPVVSLQGRVQTGGRLNAAAAVGAPGADTTGAYIFSSTPSGSVSAPISSVRVAFSEPINAATFTTADIVSFTGPTGQIAVSSINAVSGSGNREFDIRFGAMSTLGTYTMVIGPNVLDTAGNSMNQDHDSRNGEVQDRYTLTFTASDLRIYSSANVPIPIIDGANARSRLTINDNIQIADLNVVLNVTHTWDGDLKFFLRSPSGTETTLVNFRGGSGNNFTRTILDDEAAQSISAGTAPFTGSFRPEQPLSRFDGQSARGTWQLRVQDWYRGDQGLINGWSLVVDPVEPNLPPVVNDQTFTIAENSPAGTGVGTVSASDPNTDESLTFGLVGGSGLGVFAIHGDSGQITVADPARIDFETVQSFDLALRVTDHAGLFDTAIMTISVNDANDAPVIGRLNDRQILRKTGPLVVNLSAADADGDRITFSADIGGDPADELAVELHNQHGFHDRPGLADRDYHRNFRGFDEVYVLGTGFDGQTRWYFILPDGSLYHQNYLNFEASELLGVLDATYHANPGRLWTVTESVPADVSSSLNGNTLTLTPNDAFFGKFLVTVAATDGMALTESRFIVDVLNSTPTIASLPDQRIPHNVGPLQISLSSNDADGDELMYSVEVVDEPVELRAHAFHLVHGFHARPGLEAADFHYDFRGQRERYFLGTGADSQAHWYFILPDGSLYLQNTSDFADSERLTTLNANFHADPTLLWANGALPAEQAASTRAYALNEVHDFYARAGLPEAGYYFDFRGHQEKYFLGTDSNGQARWYFILPDGSVYLQSPSNFDDSQRLTILNSSFHADPSRIWNAAAPATTSVTTSITGDTLTIDPADGYLGTFGVNVTVSDGLESATESFNVSVTNSAPTLDAIADQQTTFAAGPLEIILASSDADGDTVTYSVEIGADPVAELVYELDQQYGFHDRPGLAEEDYYRDFRGQGEAYFLGTDSSGQTRWYFILPDGSLYRQSYVEFNDSELVATLNASYNANPDNLINAGLAPVAATATLFGSTLVIQPFDEVVGTFEVSVTASDGYTTSSETFNVVVTAQPDVSTVQMQRTEAVKAKAAPIIDLPPALMNSARLEELPSDSPTTFSTQNNQPLVAHAKHDCSERSIGLSAPIGNFGAQNNQPLVAQRSSTTQIGLAVDYSQNRTAAFPNDRPTDFNPVQSAELIGMLISSFEFDPSHSNYVENLSTTLPESEFQPVRNEDSVENGVSSPSAITSETELIDSVFGERRNILLDALSIEL